MTRMAAKTSCQSLLSWWALISLRSTVMRGRNEVSRQKRLFAFPHSDCRKEVEWVRRAKAHLSLKTLLGNVVIIANRHYCCTDWGKVFKCYCSDLKRSVMCNTTESQHQNQKVCIFGTCDAKRLMHQERIWNHMFVLINISFFYVLSGHFILFGNFKRISQVIFYTQRPKTNNELNLSNTKLVHFISECVPDFNLKKPKHFNYDPVTFENRRTNVLWHC